MSRVERLNKTILPTLSDPGAISRQADVSAIQQAGELAGTFGQVADVGLAFKRAKDASFVAEKATTFERDVDTFFRDFKVDASSDPDGMKPEFDKFVNDRFNDLSKGGSNAALAEFSKLKGDTVFKYDQKYDDFAQRQNVQNFNTSFDNSLRDNAVTAFRAGQDGENVNEFLNNVDMLSLAGTTFMGEQDLNAITQEGKAVTAQEWAQGRLEAFPVQFREELDNGDYDNVLSSDQIQSLGKLADAKQQDIADDLKKQETKERNIRESELSLAIKTGDTLTDFERIDQQIEQSKDTLGIITANKLRGDAFTARKEVRKKAERIQLGSLYASGDRRLNPNDAEGKKAYNEFYKSLAPDIAELPPEQQNLAKAKIVDNARFVPEIIKGELSLAARSQNSDEITQAADLIDRVTAINPNLIADLGSETELARIQMVNQRINAGFQPSQAIEATDKILDPRNAATEEVIREELKTINKNFKYREEAFSNFETILLFDEPRREGAFVTPELDGMTARYRIAFEDHYRITRDKDVSKKYADKVIKGQYGNSNVNGFKQILQFNPEQYYSIPGENNKWMREQMLDEAFNATRNDIPLPSKKDLKKNLRLVVEPNVTPRSAAAGEPLYKLFLISGDAPIDVLNGKLFKFDPDKRREELVKGAKENPIESLFGSVTFPGEKE